MNQSINTDSKNSKEPQQKYRLGTVSIKILGGLNQFNSVQKIFIAGSIIIKNNPESSILFSNFSVFALLQKCQIRGQ